MLTNASMITADADRDAVVLLGTRVPLDQPAQQVAAAVFAGTADGVYEARINDQPVTDSVLNPGWTAYEWRLQVQHFDVSSLLTGGGTDHVALEVRLGNGWYRGDLGFAGPNANYGKQIGFVAELVSAIGTVPPRRSSPTPPGPHGPRTPRAAASTSARRSLGAEILIGPSGRGRVIVPGNTFADYLFFILNLLAWYGGGDITVMMALLRLVRSCVDVVGVDADRLAILDRAAADLLDDAGQTLLRPGDLADYRDAVQQVRRKIGRASA